MAYGRVLGVTAISESGKIIRHMDMGYILGWLETSMRVSGNSVSGMVKEQTFLLMGMFMWANTPMANLKDKGSINGLMEILTLEGSKGGLSMDRDDGSNRQVILKSLINSISLRELMSTI